MGCTRGSMRDRESSLEPRRLNHPALNTAVFIAAARLLRFPSCGDTVIPFPSVAHGCSIQAAV